MAVNYLLSHTISDLCLGKPALRSLPAAATVGETLSALKNSEEKYLSVWSCQHHHSTAEEENECRCVGKVRMVDVITYLCKGKNVFCHSDALQAPVSEILTKIPGLVVHVEPETSLLEAIDLILEGAQNLVVPIQNKFLTSTRRKNFLKQSNHTNTIHNGHEFCWLTQEDIVRFLLNSIGILSPFPALSIDNLGIISTDVLAVRCHSPASSALEAISRSHIEQTSVAVVDNDGILIGELSPASFACQDESVAAAIMTLSSGELMAYIDCGGPSEDLVKLVNQRVKDMKLGKVLYEFAMPSLPNTVVTKLGRLGRSWSSNYSSRMVRRSEAIVCHPKSSMVAVMIQAIAHRVNYLWVVDDDCRLIGIVTFYSMLDVLRDHLDGSN